MDLKSIPLTSNPFWSFCLLAGSRTSIICAHPPHVIDQFQNLGSIHWYGRISLLELRWLLNQQSLDHNLLPELQQCLWYVHLIEEQSYFVSDTDIDQIISLNVLISEFLNMIKDLSKIMRAMSRLVMVTKLVAIHVVMKRIHSAIDHCAVCHWELWGCWRSYQNKRPKFDLRCLSTKRRSLEGTRYYQYFVLYWFWSASNFPAIVSLILFSEPLPGSSRMSSLKSLFLTF